MTMIFSKDGTRSIQGVISNTVRNKYEYMRDRESGLSTYALKDLGRIHWTCGCRGVEGNISYVRCVFNTVPNTPTFVLAEVSDKDSLTFNRAGSFSLKRGPLFLLCIKCKKGLVLSL